MKNVVLHFLRWMMIYTGAFWIVASVGDRFVWSHRPLATYEILYTIGAGVTLAFFVAFMLILIVKGLDR